MIEKLGPLPMILTIEKLGPLPMILTIGIMGTSIPKTIEFT